MSTKKAIRPDYEQITPFLRGQASKILKDVYEKDKILIVNKQGKPQNVIISYERYIKLIDEGVKNL